MEDRAVTATGDDPRVGGAHGNRREEIVDAALELIAERGYRRASLAQVAARVGITAQGLLHYFPTKDDLLVAVLAERARREEVLAAASPEVRPDVDSLLRWLTQVLQRNTGEPRLTQLHTVLSADSLTEGHPAQDVMRERYREVRDRFVEFIAATDSGAFPGRRAEGLAALIVAAMDGLQLQWLLDRDRVDMAETFELFREAVLALLKGTADRAE
ncbi:TetR/AcrR family transcriptional regulator [Actinoallomurus sp. NPDC052308]|uniref:TetR/AcrR family transcriptional regulator n=1 Tax=Actinoallomurus sp. NPDC052308 TaxID=3155530 RepID=UPI00343372C0